MVERRPLDQEEVTARGAKRKGAARKQRIPFGHHASQEPCLPTARWMGKSWQYRQASSIHPLGGRGAGRPQSWDGASRSPYDLPTPLQASHFKPTWLAPPSARHTHLHRRGVSEPPAPRWPLSSRLLLAPPAQGASPQEQMASPGMCAVRRGTAQHDKRETLSWE